MATGGHDLETTDRTFLINLQESGLSEAIDETSFSTATPRIVSVLQNFKNTSVYMLEFTHKQRDTGDTIVSVDEDFVVRLHSDEEQNLFNDLKKAFTVTEVEIDSQNSIIKLGYTQTERGGCDTWKESVIKYFRARSGFLLRWEIVDIGSEAGAVKLQVEKQFSSYGVICELSQDNQKLLLLSQSHDELKAAARKAFSSLAALRNYFQTKSGIKISVIKSDITLVPADCVVSAVDDQLSLGGGVSYKIAQAAGQQMIKECTRYIKKHGPLLVAKVFVSSGGQRWKNVIHASGPRWKDYSDKNECLRLLTETIFNCLKEASNKEHRTIALPSVSSGTFQVPVESSAQCYRGAIEKFDKDCGDTTTLKHILFVDVDHDKVSRLQNQMSESETVKATEALRLVLVSKTGVGKSSTGNSILGGQSFSVSAHFSSETQESRMGTVVHNNVTIEVVDTPGLFDETDDDEEKNKKRAEMIEKEILKSVVLSLPGPHVICFCLRGDDRFTKAEKQTYQNILKLFPEELTKFMLVVITHSPTNGKYSLDDLRRNLPPFLSTLFTDVQDRVISIDNEGKNVDDQVQSLVKMAIELRDENSSSGKPFYSNSLVSRCLQLMQSDEFAEKSLDDIKEEIQQPNASAMDRVLKDEEARVGAQKTTELCNIL